MGNSFGFTGHIRDKLVICGSVNVLVSWFLDCFWTKTGTFLIFNVFSYSKYSYLENFKCSSRATLRCLAGRMWPAGRTLPRPGLASTCLQNYHTVPYSWLQCTCKKLTKVHYVKCLVQLFEIGATILILRDESYKNIYFLKWFIYNYKNWCLEIANKKITAAVFLLFIIQYSEL